MRLGLLSHTPGLEIRAPNQLPQSWRQLIVSNAKVVVGLAIGAVGLVVTVLSLRPILDVSTSFQSDQNNPYSEVFVVTNGGLLPLYNLQLTCVQDWFKDSNGNFGAMNIREARSPLFLKLGPGAKTSIRCTPAAKTNNQLIEASISLIIKYQTLLPNYTLEKSFNFLGILAKDGQMHWTPKS